MTSTGLAYPKPEPRKKVKARERRSWADHVKAVRDFVFGRERGICRCCRWRDAESMHELVFRSQGGKVSRKNSIAVCGDGVRGCHGFLQRHEINYMAGAGGAQSTLGFTAMTEAAADYMRIKRWETIMSPLMRETDACAVRPFDSE